MRQGEKEVERERRAKLRQIIRDLAEAGIEVRREELLRGPAYRVRSGNCLLSGKITLFIDARLTTEQQLTLLIDYMQDNTLKLKKPSAAAIAAQSSV